MPDIKHFDPDAALERAERLFWKHGTGSAESSVQAVTTATGLNRSSLYATFGSKHDLYLAALRRYLDHRARPAFRRLAEDQRGLPAIRDFFTALIDIRCTGEHSGWGCMFVNAHVDPQHNDPGVRALLDEHHRLLRDALRSALQTAVRLGQLATTHPIEGTAETLALLAYGINLRSRAGATAEELLGTLHSALAQLSPRA
ncbi:TetR/AcrR family transcriptional regulator [Streptomyces orinoci]|uniref:TetR/AcrR family transcriptional regulator n=1 Tax=Streptomyces orinoci TaxID=67339 RepID=A0ABV3JV11_STRON|nr:TetR/AcrR family transcriptional regulator [Streptomyces orinoci]